MTTWIERKRRGNVRDNLRAHAVLPYAPQTLADHETVWEAEFRESLRWNPMEPRLAVPWQLLEAVERWARRRRWTRSGFGPNGHRNGFNVFFQPIGSLTVPGPGLAWSTDELNGAEDGL